MSLNDYTFREAGVTDFPGIEQLFIEYDLGPIRPQGWTAWKYLQSPDGPAHVFISEDAARSIVGLLVYMPRRFTSAKTGVFVAMCVVDIFVNPDLRKSGIFLRLLHYARQRMDVPKFGVPNDSSAVFARSPGWQVLGPYETWVFLLSLNAILPGKKLEWIGSLSKLVCRAYTFLWLGGRPRNLEMRPVQRFRTNYTLDSESIHGIRSAEYLNWRFVDNPIGRYFSYEFYDGTEAVGYCVYAQAAACAVLFDFVVTRRRNGCMRLFIDHCRKAGMTHVTFKGAGLGLKRLGFLRRGINGDCRKYKVPDGEWVIAECDVDYELDESDYAPGDAGSRRKSA